jgi:hypothetical protein
VSRNFGHAMITRTERPDSVTVPSEEKLTLFQRVIVTLGAIAGGVLGVSVAHGLYVGFLK